MVSRPLNELLYGLFYDVFKRVGVPIGLEQMDNLRAVTDKITIAIQDEIKDGMKRVITVTLSEMKDLEERVKSGQKNTEETRNS